jgi:hypothetical protein
MRPKGLFALAVRFREQCAPCGRIRGEARKNHEKPRSASAGYRKTPVPGGGYVSTAAPPDAKAGFFAAMKRKTPPEGGAVNL